MNSDLGNKLSNLEAIPPEGVWQNLAAALDNGVSAPFARKLYDYEQAPAAAVWNAVNDSLNKEDSAMGFAQKLYEYQQDPPTSAWPAIEAALYPGAAHSYAQKLFSFTAEPPAGAWEAITAQLAPAPATARVVPLYRKYARHTGVAAMIALAVFFTSMLISKKTVSDRATATAPQHSTNVPLHLQTSQVAVIQTPNADLIPVKKEPKLTQIRRTFAAAISNVTGLPGSIVALNNVLPETADRAAEITSGTPTDKYMIYSDDEGNAVKLPKKLFDDFVCSADETGCKERLRYMREQLSSASFSTDFTSVMDMISNLQGK